MRPALLLPILAALSVASGAARADTYSFGGRSGRVTLDVLLLGFNEGGGVGGWDEGHARAFATLARRVDTFLPEGATVWLERPFEDRETTLTIREGAASTVFLVDETPGYYDDALELVAAHFGVTRVAEVSPPKLYTIQLLATRSGERARRHARALDERGVIADGSFFHEACGPCATREAHVLGPDARGWHRVVTGLFDQPGAAQRSLGALRRRWKMDAFVREL